MALRKYAIINQANDSYGESCVPWFSQWLPLITADLVTMATWLRSYIPFNLLVQSFDIGASELLSSKGQFPMISYNTYDIRCQDLLVSPNNGNHGNLCLDFLESIDQLASFFGIPEFPWILQHGITYSVVWYISRLYVMWWSTFQLHGLAETSPYLELLAASPLHQHKLMKTVAMATLLVRQTF